jgi:hypothetical protein
MAADPRLVALVESQASVLEQLTQALIDLLAALFDLIDPYKPGDVDRYVTEASRAVLKARREAVGATDAFTKGMLLLADIVETGPMPLPGKEIGGLTPVPELPRGIPLTEEWVRPVKEYRRLRLDGLDDLQARLRAKDRSGRMAWADVATASRDTAAHRLAVAEPKGVTGWRRIIHPELSAGGTCGLCLVASDRVYGVRDLQPLHSRCKCTIAPIVGENDPGLALSQDSLAAVYRLAGDSTFAQDLARVRIQVREHAELGPTLVNARHAWRGPDQVGQDAAALAESLQQDLAEMRERLARAEALAVGGDEGAVAQRAWLRDRVAAVEELIDAA